LYVRTTDFKRIRLSELTAVINGGASFTDNTLLCSFNSEEKGLNNLCKQNQLVLIKLFIVPDFKIRSDDSKKIDKEKILLTVFNNIDFIGSFYSEFFSDHF
jgi:hypothetical protein